MLKFISNGDYKIAYKVTGKGFPLVFIHGFCEDGRMWDDFAKKFSDYQVIALDLPGFGKTDLVPDLTISKMADTVKLVLEKCRVSECCIVGHSMGGYVLMDFVSRFSKDYGIQGVVMFHSHPFADSKDRKSKRAQVTNYIDAHGVAIFVHQFLPSLFSGFFNSNRFTVQKLTFRASQYTKESLMASLNAMRNRKDHSKTMENINCPVLFINGLQDEIIPLDKMIEQTALPNIADIRNMEDVGHVGMFEAPNRTSRYIRDFLARL